MDITHIYGGGRAFVACVCNDEPEGGGNIITRRVSGGDLRVRVRRRSAVVRRLGGRVRSGGICVSSVLTRTAGLSGRLGGCEG